MTTNIFELTGQEECNDPTSWGGLPEFVQEDNEAPYIVVVRFRNHDDMNKFADIIGYDSIKTKQKNSKKSIWYPDLIAGERGTNSLMCWIEEDEQNQ